MVAPNARPAGRSVLLYSLLIATGCQPAIPAALAVDPNEPPGYRWLICPGGNPQDPVRGVIGPAGGTLTHSSGHALTVPREALDRDHTFVLQEPLSQQLVVVATVQPETRFQAPINLTISYDRCTTAVDPSGLAAFRLNRGGDHDRLDGEAGPPRSFRAVIPDHLSAYALATN
jgi:hypothetical protein